MSVIKSDSKPCLNELEIVARAVRSFCFAANKHPGGSLSSAEAVTALFFGGAARFGTAEEQRDSEIVHGPMDILDHAAPDLGAGSKIGFDATHKWPGETSRECARRFRHACTSDGLSDNSSPS
jgi:hypothetical protein